MKQKLTAKKKLTISKLFQQTLKTLGLPSVFLYGEDMKLIVGLGNPGEKYANNRHNIGFWVVEALADKYGATSFKDKFHGKFATCEIDGEKVGLLMPHTYMNESGRAVQAAATFYKTKPADIVVIHDELDIEPAKVKMKIGGGDAGHNGLKSITSALGQNYVRVRIGIGHPGDKDKVHGYVLRDFPKAEIDTFEILSNKLADIMPQVLEGDFAQALTALTL